MTDFNALDVCRLCLASGEKMGELNNKLTYIISTCFSLKICMSSELTNKVCQACVDQLENVYKYRNDIIRNEISLLEKSRGIIDYHKLSSEDLQVNNADRVKNGRITYNFSEFDAIDDDLDPNEPYMNDKDHTEIEKQDKDTIIESENDAINIVEEDDSRMNIDKMLQDLNFDKNKLHKLNVLERLKRQVDLNISIKDQYDIKLNQDVTKSEDLVENKSSLEANEKNLTTIELKVVNKSDSILETDKENTDINNFATNDLTENAFVFRDQEQAGVILNQEQSDVNNVERKFMCLTCFKVFGSQKELSIHYKTDELSKTVKESSRKYKEPNIVTVSKNDGCKSVFKCGVCNKVFENKASVVKHIQIHKVDRPFLCNLCSRTYKTVADILRHGVVHNGFKFVCQYECGYTTAHLGALREHVKRHKKEYKYKCDKCGKCFQVKTWYDQHQNVHDKVRPFVCKLCGQAFSMTRYLMAHQANVHPQSSKVKRYKCVHCALPCDSRRSLVLHMKQKHGMKTDCLCDVCGQILPDQQKLMLHKSVHESLRKFSCRFCKKAFNKKDHQTVHEKIHTGERLNCNSCTKSFTQRCSLRRHVKRYHQGDQQAFEQKT